MTTTLLALGLFGALAGQAPKPDVFDRVKHGYATSADGVKIHYASLGEGPLIVMIHGFPDFWYSWRQQMDALSDRYQVVAIDQRGYNLSDKPAGVENYDVRLLVGDVWKTVEVLVQTEAAFEIGEQAVHRDAGTFEARSPAKALRISPDRHFRRIVQWQARFHLGVNLAESCSL